ncbi:hypothetical protein C8R43DRAFT_1138948 [Mycena crocata]|nr:hypothetical protein C8R43DRAFT_1138948 [Mycena crocata]
MTPLKTIQIVVIACAVATFHGAKAAPSSARSDSGISYLNPWVAECRIAGANCVAIGRDTETDATWAWTLSPPQVYLWNVDAATSCDKVRLANGTDNPCLMEKFSLAQHQPSDAGLTLEGCGGPMWLDTNGQKFADCVAIPGNYRGESPCGIPVNYMCKP